MQISLPPIDLSFDNFALMAILLALMYGLTGMEAALTRGPEVGTVGADRKRAAAYAFAGILLTIAAGLVAQVGARDAEVLLFFFPLFFMAHWAYYHATSAQLANLRVIRKELEDEYTNAVLKSLSNAPMTSGQVFAIAVEKLRAVKLLQSGYGIAKIVVPVPAQSLVEDMLFSPAKVDVILGGLVAARRVSRTDGEVVAYYIT